MNNVNSESEKLSTVVLVEDDHIIRYVIKKLLSIYFKTSKYKIFTSADGVEGLGYIYITHPDVIIVDSTLPEYGGKEIADYISSNDKVNTNARKVIVLSYRGEDIENLPPDYSQLDKSAPDFIDKLLNSLKLNLELKEKADTERRLVRLMRKFAKPTVRYANLSNEDTLVLSSKSGFAKVPVFFRWIWHQFLTSAFLALLFTVTGEKDRDVNTLQGKRDLMSSRVKVFPALALIYVVLLAIIIKLVFVVVAFISFWVTTASRSIGNN